jgi:pyrrolidone-carboxylate peptidase
MVRPALVTGFTPYGGRGVNPAAEIAAALDGRTLADTPVDAENQNREVAKSQIAPIALRMTRSD